MGGYLSQSFRRKRSPGIPGGLCDLSPHSFGAGGNCVGVRSKLCRAASSFDSSATASLAFGEAPARAYLAFVFSFVFALGILVLPTGGVLSSYDHRIDERANYLLPRKARERHKARRNAAAPRSTAAGSRPRCTEYLICRGWRPRALARGRRKRANAVAKLDRRLRWGPGE